MCNETVERGGESHFKNRPFQAPFTSFRV